MATVIANQTRTRYVGNRSVGIVGGSSYSTNSVAYRTFGAECFDRVTRTRSTRTRSEAALPIAVYVDQFVAALEAGEVILGNYREVFSRVALEAGLQVEWAGYRGNHIAEAGRRFETITGVGFDTICPDLRATAGDWVSAIS